jgi:hypothetical protein
MGVTSGRPTIWDQVVKQPGVEFIFVKSDTAPVTPRVEARPKPAPSRSLPCSGTELDEVHRAD